MLCYEHWKGIHIEEEDVREPGAFEKIVSWYGRAGRLPKTLEFFLGGDDGICECDGGDDCRFLNPTLITLLKGGPTLDRLSLKISKPSCLFRLLDAIGARNTSPNIPLPWVNLRSIMLDFSDVDDVVWDDAERATDSFFNYLPQVTSLSLYMPGEDLVFHGDGDAALAASIHLPPSLLCNLTSFEVRCNWEGSHILRTLENCPQLEKLVIDLFGESFFHDSDPDTPPWVKRAAPPRLLLPRLHTLRLDSQQNLHVLDHLKTPALCSLHLDVYR